MSPFDLPAFAKQLNAKADTHPIGQLQRIRVQLHGLQRQPGHKLFSSQSIKNDWAFHHGGRSELQYNIGKDGSNDTMMRYGVAFSFETSQTLPTIDVLVPKVRSFNEFLRIYPDLYADMRMWHWRDGARSSESSPGPIPPDFVAHGVFLFLGHRKPVIELDHDSVLTVMDRLLPLYKYVESNGRAQPLSDPHAKEFVFRSGCPIKPATTTATLAQKQLDVDLRHNMLQQALYRKLVREHGHENVGSEVSTGIGTSIDLVVRQPNGYWFYEIKTFQSPRACVREALGQLLEYSFWPGSQEARRLIIVGESAPDEDVRNYCRCLNKRFSLPIEYQKIVPESG